MLNNFGKFCRKLRIDKNELLYDMAAKLGVSSAFLSKVENGKKKPPQEWRNLLIEKYNLEDYQICELDECLFEAQNYNSIDMSGWKEDDRMMMLSFARKFSSLNKDILKQFLDEEGGK